LRLMPGEEVTAERLRAFVRGQLASSVK
jgi:hypothetical protein